MREMHTKCLIMEVGWSIMEVNDNQVLSVNFKNYTLWIGGRKLYVSRMVFKFAMEYFRYIN